MYAAFTVAALMGLAVFVIWWVTAPNRPGAAATGSPASPAPSPISKEEVIEAALPRGGALAGSTGDMTLAAQWLTGAPLVRVNRSTDELESWLAESWTVSEDNLIYIVKLRPGLTAVDGTALTAEGVARFLPGLAALDKPVAVRAVDSLTLELRFASPFAPGLRLLDNHPIPGFGPFAEVTVQSAERVFRRNPHYWRKAANGSPLPYLDEIKLRSTAVGPAEDFSERPIRAEDFEAVKKLDAGGKVRLFELGPGLDADALWLAPAGDAAAADLSAEARTADLSRRSAEGAKADRPWLYDERFRLAVSAAVDRREYCKQVFYGACDPMVTPVSPANVAWFNPDFPLGPGNPQLARAMLAELGLRDRTGDGFLDDATLKPLRVTVLIRRDVSSSARAARFLADTFKAIGVHLEVTPLDAKSLDARRQKGNYDAIYDRVEMRDTDPAMNLDFWLSFGTADWARQMRELLLKNATSFNRAERVQAFVDAQKIYLQHMPAIFFGAPYVRVATSVRTLNATPSPLRPHIVWNAEGLAALN